jgi:hypothetical protein
MMGEEEMIDGGGTDEWKGDNGGIVLLLEIGEYCNG